MANTEPILNLLRTNSVTFYLQRRSRNDYVMYLRELLYELGYSNELQWKRLGPDNFYGEETVYAVRFFAQRSRITSDGGTVTPQLAIRMIQRYDTIDGIKLMQESINNGLLSAVFRLEDPNNYGAQQLRTILQSLNVYEPDLKQALQAYARRQGLYEDGSVLTPNLALAILNDVLPTYGDDFQRIEQPTNPQPPAPKPLPIDPIDPLPKKELEVVESNRSILVSDGNIQIDFRKHEPEGVSTYGFHNVTNFVTDHRNKLEDLELSPEGINVVEAVARNEGNLDAINTYDRGFLSMGIYQWTMGIDNGAGELPALLQKLKTNYPAAFRAYFQDFGLDIAPGTNTTYGYLSYNGRLIQQPYEKDQFREPEWAFRFWKAAQDTNVQAVQIMHALSRLKNFYWKDNFRVNGYKLNEVITSSFGVALLLDNHVNRPSWVGKCVEQALIETRMTGDPNQWQRDQEIRVLDAYRKIRETYSENGYAPMTKARERARKIEQELTSGRLSDERGSFKVTEYALRNYDVIDPRNAEKGVAPPPYYAQEDYPDIVMPPPE